jgi:hypothetical protein
MTTILLRPNLVNSADLNEAIHMSIIYLHKNLK